MAKTHHTKNKGDIGLLKVQCACAEQGYTVLLPLTEHATYDLVIEKDGLFKRVQAKYRKKSKRGTLDVSFKSSWSDKNGLHHVPVDKSSVDIYAVYCPDTDKVYFFDVQEFGKSVSLRVDEPKNNQSANVKFASDYYCVP